MVDPANHILRPSKVEAEDCYTELGSWQAEHYPSVLKLMVEEGDEGYLHYARLTGDITLIGYCKRLAEQYRFLATEAKTWHAPNPQPFVVLGTTESSLRVGLGRIKRPIGRDEYPKEVFCEHERRGTTDIFRLRLNLGSKLDVIERRRVSRTLRHDSGPTIANKGVVLEVMKWKRDSKDIDAPARIERTGLHTVVAFGRTAIQSLPEFRKIASIYKRSELWSEFFSE